MNDSMNNAADELRDLGESASKAGKRAGTSVQKQASKVGKAVTEAVGQAGRAIGEGYEQFSDKARESLQQGRETAGRLESELEDQVRQRPVSAVLMAVGIGLVAGFVLRGLCTHSRD